MGTKKPSGSKLKQKIIAPDTSYFETVSDAVKNERQNITNEAIP